jgi:hypothetical protein
MDSFYEPHPPDPNLPALRSFVDTATGTAAAMLPQVSFTLLEQASQDPNPRAQMKTYLDQKEIAARMANGREWARSLLDSEILHLLSEADNRTAEEMIVLREEAKRRNLEI